MRSPMRQVSGNVAGAGLRRCCSTPMFMTPRRSRAPPSSRAGRCRGHSRCSCSTPETSGRATRHLDSDVLAGSDAAGAWVVLPDPDGPGRAAALPKALGSNGAAHAALGPTVAPADAARSLRWARLTLELVKRNALPSDRPTRTEEHLATLIVLHDADMARALSDTRLAPINALPDTERERLIETLSAWLAHQRRTPDVAAALHVHPQTVRYRVTRLRDLLGRALDTPDGRFELELALRARPAPPR